VVDRVDLVEARLRPIASGSGRLRRVYESGGCPVGLKSIIARDELPLIRSGRDEFRLVWGPFGEWRSFRMHAG
jgi:hypothetical protein